MCIHKLTQPNLPQIIQETTVTPNTQDLPLQVSSVVPVYRTGESRISEIL